MEGRSSTTTDSMSKRPGTTPCGMNPKRTCSRANTEEKPNCSRSLTDSVSHREQFALDGEPYVQDVAFLDGVVLAFHPQQSCGFGRIPGAGTNQILVGDCLRAYEATLEVRVDHAGCLGSLGAASDLPRSALIGSGGEKREQADSLVAGRNYTVDAGFLDAEAGQEFGRVAGIHSRDLRLERGADCQRAGG